MNERRGELSGKLWLAMLKEGGRWKPKELAQKVREDGVLVSQALNSMVTTGYARRFPRTERFFVYGVTPDCRVPMGVTVREVAEHVLAQPSDTEEVPA